MSGQALFWSVHHWSVLCQIEVKTDSRRHELTFGCISDRTGVNRLADSELGELRDGNGDEQAEMHLDFDDFFVRRILV